MSPNATTSLVQIELIILLAGCLSRLYNADKFAPELCLGEQMCGILFVALIINW
jgi:hypothetical protein